MREDFDKVLVERPRRGARVRRAVKHYDRRQIERDDGQIPTFESSSRARGGTKHLNENFGPLLRFLRASVGRPWNSVHAELCEHVRLDNAVQRHTLEHLRDFVLHPAVVVGREVYGVRDTWPEYSDRDRRFYVCPRTGLLRRCPRAPKQARSAPEFVAGAHENEQFWCVDGVWFRVTLAPLPRDPGVCVFDALLRRLVRPDAGDRYLLQRHYRRGDVYAVARAQLDSRAIRRAGLGACARK